MTSLPVSSRRAVALAAFLAVLAACNNTPTATTSKPKASTKPKASATATPTPDEATPTPKPTTTATPTAAVTPTPTPPVAVSAPPIAFPYTTVGSRWDYSLDVKVSTFDIAGTTSISVTTVTATDATIGTTFAITKFPLGTPPSPTTSSSKVLKSVQNPYALGVLFPAQSSGGAAPTDTVTASAADKITLANGTSVDCTKYTVVELVDGARSDITLWTAADGSMAREIITSDKPPPLVTIPPTFAAFVKGKVTTTLELTGQSKGDGTGSGAASPDGGASSATGAASPDASATS